LNQISQTASIKENCMTIVRIGKTHRLCDAAIYNGIAYLSGAVGRTGTDVATQIKAALDEIDEVLKEAGTDKTRLLSATIWLADIADIGVMNGLGRQGQSTGPRHGAGTASARKIPGGDHGHRRRDPTVL